MKDERIQFILQPSSFILWISKMTTPVATFFNNLASRLKHTVFGEDKPALSIAKEVLNDLDQHELLELSKFAINALHTLEPNLVTELEGFIAEIKAAEVLVDEVDKKAEDLTDEAQQLISGG